MQFTRIWACKQGIIRQNQGVLSQRKRVIISCLDYKYFIETLMLNYKLTKVSLHQNLITCWG